MTHKCTNCTSITHAKINNNDFVIVDSDLIIVNHCLITVDAVYYNYIAVIVHFLFLDIVLLDYFTLNIYISYLLHTLVNCCECELCMCITLCIVIVMLFCTMCGCYTE